MGIKIFSRRVFIAINLVFYSSVASAITLKQVNQFGGAYKNFVVFDDKLVFLKGRGGIEFFRHNEKGRYEFVSRGSGDGSHCIDGAGKDSFFISSCGVFDLTMPEKPIYLGPSGSIQHIIGDSAIGLDSVISNGQHEFKIRVYSFAQLVTPHSESPTPINRISFIDAMTSKVSSASFGHFLFFRNRIFDFSNSTHPQFVGDLGIGGTPYAVAGNALVTPKSVYSLTNIFAPEMVADLNLSIDFITSINGVGRSACLNYATDSHCFDFSIPHSPVAFAKMPGGFDTALLGENIIRRSFSELTAELWDLDSKIGTPERYTELNGIKESVDLLQYENQFIHLMEWGGLISRSVDENFEFSTLAKLDPAGIQQNLSMKIQGNRLFVHGFAGLAGKPFAISVIDVGSEMEFQQVGTLRGDFAAFDVMDSMVYALSSSKLFIYDFTNPKAPRKVNELGYGGKGVIYALGKAYIKAPSGIIGLDVKDATNVQEIHDDLTNNLKGKRVDHFSKVGAYLVVQARLNDFDSEFYFFGLNGKLIGRTSPTREIKQIGSAGFLADGQILLSQSEGSYMSISLETMKLNKVLLKDFAYGSGGYGKLILIKPEVVVEAASSGFRFFKLETNFN